MLALSARKCCALYYFFETSLPPIYYLHGQPLRATELHKHCGMTFDNKLRFNVHYTDSIPPA